jgi:DNA replication protein DnaC
MSPLCEACNGLGLIPGSKGSYPCQCQEEERRRIRLQRAGIPPGFAGATLGNFQVRPHTSKAHLMVRRYAEEFLPGNNRSDKRAAGILLTGSVGTGKTHLAVGVARYLVEERGIEARFVTVPELLDRLRSSYDTDARESQAQILRPIFSADLVVIDELGAQRASDWVFDTVELLIGGLYNRMTPVIVTSNFQNLPAGGSTPQSYERAARQETLGDRIGARMFSRLQQMCAPMDMSGPDWRAGK